MDDFCWAGSCKFERLVINEIRKIFCVKSEQKHIFKYLGLDLFQDKDQIVIKQDKFVQKMELISVKRKCSPCDLMTEDELTQCRSAIGKLNWLATQTRPDLSFEVSELTSALKHRDVSTIQKVNKSIRKAKRESSQIKVH